MKKFLFIFLVGVLPLPTYVFSQQPINSSNMQHTRLAQAEGSGAGAATAAASGGITTAAVVAAVAVVVAVAVAASGGGGDPTVPLGPIATTGTTP